MTSASIAAGRVLADMVITVEQQAAALGSPSLSRVLRAPLPYDSADIERCAIMLDLMPPVGGAVMLRDAWNKLHPAVMTSVQSSSPFALQTGVSGVGKTKAAYDIGLRHSFVVVSRPVEKDVLTPPWAAFRDFAEMVARTATRGDDGLPPLEERVALKAALMVLVGAHLEWAVAVSEAAVSDTHAAAFAVAAASHLAADWSLCPPAADAPAEDAADLAVAGAGAVARRIRVLQELVLRAQRNGLAQNHVAGNFRRAMSDLLTAPDAFMADGPLQVAVVAAKRCAVWSDVDGSPPRIVWAHDEVQVLLDVVHFPSRGLFKGTHTRGGVAASGPHADVHYGYFYGLLAAVVDVMLMIRSGHLLLGSSLDLSSELLDTNSPAQGSATATQQAVHLTVADIRAWYAQYLTPAVMGGIRDNDLKPLTGRPLFASLFWSEIVKCCAATGPAPVDLVRAALRATVVSAREAAKVRIERLWREYRPSIHSYVPSRLLRTLFHDRVLSAGSLTPLEGARDEVKECLHRGILNVRGNDTHIRLGDEPITAEALHEVGMNLVRAGTDGIMAMLAVRMTDPAMGDVADQGPAQEACFSWALVRACLRAAASGHVQVPLLDLLEPFLARDKSGAAVHSALYPFPPHKWLVCLTEGRRGDVDTTRSPLSLLAERPTALIHRPSNAMANGDGFFMVFDSSDQSISAPAIYQAKNRTTGGLAEPLHGVDLGMAHPDAYGAEVLAHADMRQTLAAHPRWALPIRIIVTARPFEPALLRDVAWLNRTVLKESPLVLLQLTQANLGVDIAPSGRLPYYARPRHWPECALPSPIRRWSGPPLSVVVRSPDLRTTTLRVRFSGEGATRDELVAAVNAMQSEVGGGEVSYTRHWLRRGITATFTHSAPAIEAVSRCRDSAGAVRLRAGGVDVDAEFVV